MAMPPQLTMRPRSLRARTVTSTTIEGIAYPVVANVEHDDTNAPDLAIN